MRGVTDPNEILNLQLPRNGAEAKTVRDYLKALLWALWEDDEFFDAKRPFGNSGWSYDLITWIVESGIVSTENEAIACVFTAIRAL